MEMRQVICSLYLLILQGQVRLWYYGEFVHVSISIYNLRDNGQNFMKLNTNVMPQRTTSYSNFKSLPSIIPP